MTDAEIIASLREQLDEANETILQLTETLTGPSLLRYRGLRVSRSEKAILEILLNTKGIVNRVMMLRVVSAAWGRIIEVSPKSVDVAICRLRAKLRALPLPILIVSEWGEGYYLNDLNKQRLVALRYMRELE